MSVGTICVSSEMAAGNEHSIHMPVTDWWFGGCNISCTVNQYFANDITGNLCYYNL